MSDDNSLMKLDTATRLLAEAKDLGDILQMKNLAEAAVAYAKAANLGTEAQNNAAEIALRAKRKAGEVLAELERATPQTAKIISEDGHDTPYSIALEESGTTRQDAHRWEAIASMPDESFEVYIGETKQEGKELTTAGAVRAAQIARGEEPPEEGVLPTIPLKTTAQSYYSLALAMIENAIREDDGSWLLSDECMLYFEALHLPYDPYKDWAASGCKSIHEILCGLLESRYKPPNIEEQA